MRLVSNFALAALSTLLLAAAPLPRLDGVRFTWRVIPSAEDAKTRNAAPPSMTFTIAGEKMRGEYLEARPGMSAGSYSITDVAAGTMTLVDPSKKQATVMNMSDAAGGVAALVSGFGFKVDVSDVQTTVTDLGAGERLIGRATHKYRVLRSYVISTSMLGRKSSSRHQDSIESWITSDFAGQRAFDQFSRSFARGFQMLGADAMKKLMADEDKQPKGVPLRQVVTSTQTPDKGDPSTTTTTMEMVDYSSGSFDAALFTVPAGYKIIDLKAELAEASKEADKARSDCEAEKGKGKCDDVGAAKGDSSAKESPKDAAKKALRGLFRKP